MSVLRVAVYVRVSTDEQALHGLSVATQVEVLDAWIRDHGHVLVDHYMDEGVSGGKDVEKRPEMVRLLRDVEKDLVDLIIFTKLDRWFRSVRNYYRVQDILDQHRCAWNAINEDYETQTSGGRFRVNIMLSVAEQERERTAERIRDVIGHKQRLGQYVASPGTQAWGYIVTKDKKLAKDPETAAACSYFWDQVLLGRPYSAVGRECNERWGTAYGQGVWGKRYHNPIYKGEYRGQPGFCEAYVDPDRFDALQTRPAAKRSRNGLVYLFSSLLICPVCGGRLHAKHCVRNEKAYISYECTRHADKLCPWRRNVGEVTLEKAMIAAVPGALSAAVHEARASAAADPDPEDLRRRLQQKIRRLGVAYVDGALSDDEYARQMEEAKKALADLGTSSRISPAADESTVASFLDGSLISVYAAMTQEEKRMFWRALISRVELDESGEIRKIVFCPAL